MHVGSYNIKVKHVFVPKHKSNLNKEYCIFIHSKGVKLENSMKKKKLAWIFAYGKKTNSIWMVYGIPITLFFWNLNIDFFSFWSEVRNVLVLGVFVSSDFWNRTQHFLHFSVPKKLSSVPKERNKILRKEDITLPSP